MRQLRHHTHNISIAGELACIRLHQASFDIGDLPSLQSDMFRIVSATMSSGDRPRLSIR
ncbi:hypothetical protein [Inquilinus sp. OTU3971]|uniref:hypothetical protein n=1 Tax=Inquilinus sp. OTU3971 TaxID=3043855 RepID=UPI00313B3325